MMKYNVFSILGLVFAFIFSPLGLVFSIVALHQLKTKKEKGHGLALAGLIISIISLVIAVIWVIVVIVMVGSMVSSGLVPY